MLDELLSIYALPHEILSLNYIDSYYFQTYLQEILVAASEPP